MRLKAIWLITLVFGLVLAADWLPQLRGDLPSLLDETGWVWPYGPPRWGWLLPCVIGIGLYLIVALVALRQPVERWVKRRVFGGIGEVKELAGRPCAVHPEPAGRG